MSGGGDLEGEVRRTVATVMAMPYVWPSPPDAASAARSGVGTCASKHALLAERLRGIGVASRPLFVVGPLVPSMLVEEEPFRAGMGLREVHECLTVSMPEVGPLVVDVTWDPDLVERGLPGTVDWDGRSDMTLATGPTAAPAWAPDPSHLREEKEALRSRIYSGSERATRDRVLAAMSETFASWRAERDGPG